MKFQVFIERKGNQKDPLELMIEDVTTVFHNNEIQTEVIDINGDDNSRKEAEKIGLDEVPALLFEKVRISGQLNEYFILACIAQLLTSDGNDQKGSNLLMTENESLTKLKVASELLTHETKIREETKTFLLLIRESTDDFEIDKLQALADLGTSVFILTNFEEGKNIKNLAALGKQENILLGHILRTNIHMTLAITVRKGRPFFGAFLRAKETEKGWKGKWSPLLHDTVNELKNFYIPLFMTSGPVHLDGTYEEGETNRLVAKVKDNIEIIRALFF